MADDKPENDVEDKAPGKFSSSVKRGALEGAIGVAGGAGVGAGIGAVVKESTGEGIREDALKALRKFRQEGKELLDKETDAGKIAKYTKKLEGYDEIITRIGERSPRKTAVIAFATRGAIAIGVILGAHGLYKGYKNAKDKQDDIDALKTDAGSVRASQHVINAINDATGKSVY